MKGVDALKTRARRLVAAANEMLAIAKDLETLAASGADLATHEAPLLVRPVMIEQPFWLQLAKRTYAERRRRGRYFDASLFGEPACDILIDLFIAVKSDKKVSVSSACIASAVPTSTALRWITVLESLKLIVRTGDPDDARRFFLHLTPQGYAKMTDYFSDQVLQTQRQPEANAA